MHHTDRCRPSTHVAFCNSGSEPSSGCQLAPLLPQVKVPLSVEGQPSGWLHLGIFLEHEARPGEALGEALGGDFLEGA